MKRNTLQNHACHDANLNNANAPPQVKGENKHKTWLLMLTLGIKSSRVESIFCHSLLKN